MAVNFKIYFLKAYFIFNGIKKLVKGLTRLNKALKRPFIKGKYNMAYIFKNFYPKKNKTNYLRQNTVF